MYYGRYNITVIGKLFILCLIITSSLFSVKTHAAIGCTLTNPAEDLKYLFPEMTTYKEDLKEFNKIKDGEILFKELSERLGSDLDSIYESYDTPYTVYTVFQKDKKIGIVHGVNVPGKGGVIQIFLSLDPLTAVIKKFFFQRIESPAAIELKKKEFTSQFQGLSLADFYKHDYYALVNQSKNDAIVKIKAPAIEEKSKADYEASLRGVRKNLILVDFFVFGKKFEPFYAKAKEELNKSISKDKK